jgi:D-serine dehydratase
MPGVVELGASAAAAQVGSRSAPASLAMAKRLGDWKVDERGDGRPPRSKYQVGGTVRRRSSAVMTTVDGLDKGVPGHIERMSADEVAAAGWNVIREDLPLPVCVVLGDALDRNAERLQRFTDDSGLLLCPHAKTSMSPKLFQRQLDHGCWGLTLATGHQLQVARRHGVQRVLYANQLVGEAEIRYVCDELRRDAGFDFYCLVDSVAGASLLAERAARAAPGRPVQVLVEGGFAGGRCGVRDVPTAVAVAEAVRTHAPHLTLVGVEGFEGLLQYHEPERREVEVRKFIGFLVEIAEKLDEGGLFDAPEVLITAGGSAFYDLVAEGLGSASLARPKRVVLRSGCYLTHDNGIYDRLLQDVHRRTGSEALTFEPALEVWAQVLSTPEPELLILSAGRRDFGQDAGNPAPLKHVGRGWTTPRGLSRSEWVVAGVSDQHAHVTCPRGHGVEIGDLIALGPSHPCTTFDKWRVIYVVDTDYDVLDVAHTWF